MQPSDIPADSKSNPALFPETHRGLLAAAAGGRWEEFFAVYLRPCWNNLAAACRARGLELNDAEDLFQELVLRLMQSGRFGSETLRKAQEEGLSQFRGNLPARFLRLGELPLQSAKFRTYLKAVTANLLAEELRNRRRRPRQGTPEEEAGLAAWIDDSVGHSLDRMRTAEVLRAAVEQFHRETRAARTRGRRRYFAFLYFLFVAGRSPGIIALRFGLDRSTVAEAIGDAQRRFVEIVQSLCGDDSDEVVRLLTTEPEWAADAFRPYAAEVEALPTGRPAT